jgi:protein SCO1/2
MSRAANTLKFGLWAGLGLLLAGLTVPALILQSRLRAPALPVLGQITPFSLTNHLGRPVSDADLRGAVWVADIIFTRCPGPCVTMTRNFAQVQADLRPDEPVKLMSLTADPAHDTVGILRDYAASYGADASRWEFLTGEKAALYRLALDGLKLSAEEIEPAQRTNLNDLFIHSTTFILLDRQARLRAVYDGTDPATPDRVLRDARRLLRES